MKQTKTLEEIRKCFESNGSLSADKVLEWMKSDDIQVQAAVVILISEHEFEYCANGHSLPGQGIGRHRPLDKSPYDKSWRDRR